MFSYLYHQASLSQDKNIKELELCARSAWALQGAIAEPPWWPTNTSPSVAGAVLRYKHPV